MKRRQLELESNLAKVHANIKELEFKRLLKEEDIERINKEIEMQENRENELKVELSKIGE
jgi:hypothetical protein